MDENKQIEKFDPTKIMEDVKNRIKGTFVSLIPDEMWSQMLEKEIYIFTTGKIIPHHDYVSDGKYKDWEERVPYSDTDIYDSWGHLKEPAEVSPLRRMIRDELSAKFKADLEEFLKGEEYQSAFDTYGKPEISKAVEHILVNNADSIFANFMASMMQEGMQALKQGIYSKVHSGQY